jgi:hypothetical protein
MKYTVNKSVSLGGFQYLPRGVYTEQELTEMVMDSLKKNGYVAELIEEAEIKPVDLPDKPKADKPKRVK